MPRVTAIPYTSAVANIGVELILSFNGMYRRFSFMATSLLAWPNTVTRPQQGFHYRGQTSRISSTVLARPRHTVGGVPSKRLIRVSTVVIVREYHNQRCTSGLKGYATRRIPFDDYFDTLPPTRFHRVCPLFIKVTHKAKVIARRRRRISIFQNFRKRT